MGADSAKIDRKALLDWLLTCDEPWTRYRTLLDLLRLPEDDQQVVAARGEMLAHPLVQNLIATVAAWPGYPLRRHNDAKHPLHVFSTLADIGVRASDPGMSATLGAVLARQSLRGPFQTQIHLHKRFGGIDGEQWTWMACDAPTLLYVMLAMDTASQSPPAAEQVQRAAVHLVKAVDDNGWRCLNAPELGAFRGPGRRDDPCPIANVLALKALSAVPDLRNHPAARIGAEMLLRHWERQSERKLYLFGIGTKFRKLKYPFIWYDIMHVADVLSRFPFVHHDPRYCEMVDIIHAQADKEGRYTSTSMYRAWKGWSFADKGKPSPWSTFLVLRFDERAASRDTVPVR